jgi:hypothetical protein
MCASKLSLTRQAVVTRCAGHAAGGTPGSPGSAHGTALGYPNSSSRNRLAGSHWPHHGGREDGHPGATGSSSGDRRADRTAYGFRTPVLLPPVKAASQSGVQPSARAASTAGVSRLRWAGVSRHCRPRASKYSPAASARLSAGGAVPRAGTRAADGSLDGSMNGSGATAAARSGSGCTPSLRWLHPVGVSGCSGCNPVTSPGVLGAGTRGQAGELPGEGLDLVAVEVVTDQVDGQVPALRPMVRPLDLRRDHRRVTRPDDARGFQPVQRGAHRALGQLGVAHQLADTGERLAAVRARVAGQPDQHRLTRRVAFPAAITRDRRQIQRPRQCLHAHRNSLPPAFLAA